LELGFAVAAENGWRIVAAGLAAATAFARVSAFARATAGRHPAAVRVAPLVFVGATPEAQHHEG
jgi:alkanesulfonate monooxygenase SsuD/methylene tetrahydromethanopterin reductase-like flavin-dependent oxidoreductase (luciferase family)